MTKKDYVWLAEHIRVQMNRIPETGNSHRREMLCNMARDMASDLGRQNPRFDRAKFLAACGVAE
jgi:hypothetical protein